MSRVPISPIRHMLLYGLLAAGLSSASAAWAQPASAASSAAPSELQVSVWASSCMACHGTDGRAEGTGLRLQGLGADHIYRRLLAFKKRELPATIMHHHARGYSDTELALIARHFGKPL